MSRLTELQEELDKKQQELAPLRQEINELMEKDELGAKKALVGKCFVFRNSYGGDSEDWNLYMKLLRIDSEGNLREESFQETSRGELEFKHSNHWNHYVLDGYTEIEQERYDEERTRHLNKLGI